MLRVVGCANSVYFWPSMKWHTLTIEHKGEGIKVTVGGKVVFEGKVKTYPDAGKICVDQGRLTRPLR